MKSVLIITYYFPPLGMGGVQRMTKFAKYLPRFGWKPIIVTVKDVVYYAKDQTLLDELKGREIHRTESLDPLRLIYLLRDRSPRNKGEESTSNSSSLEKLNDFLNQWLYLPDSKILWWPFALSKSIKIVKKGEIDVVLTSSPPHSSHLVGFFLKKFWNIPWVTDFRDNWTGRELDRSPTLVHRNLNRFLEQLTLRNSDKVISVSEFITQDLRRKSGGGNAKFITITNGYDPEDFIGGKKVQNEKFTIVYCGTLCPVSDPKNFLAAMRMLIEENRDLRGSIRVLLVGSYYGIDLPSMMDGLDDVVKLVGYVSHKESINYLLNSDLLLFLIAPWCTPGMIKGKLFEYLASRKPILALIPEGEAAEIIRKSGRGVVIDPENINGIKKGMVKFFRLWKEGRRHLYESDEVKKYSRIALTRRLAQILDEVSHEEQNHRPDVREDG